MKAMIYREYGAPEQLRLEDVTRPEPKDHEVLVEVAAVALNASDAELLAGRPAYVRLWGLFRPRYQVLGSDIAGRVVAVGKSVTEFRPGDAVFGDLFESWGGLAEFVLAPAKLLLHIPEGLTFEAAATIPQSAVLALQCLRHRGGPAGERVMINGAGGGAGTFAIQLAKHLGAAEVTAVDHGSKIEHMRALGADRVIDYTHEEFTAGATRYDRIVDFVATRSVRDCARMLTPEGQYLVVGGTMGRIVETLLIGTAMAVFSGKRIALVGYRQNREDLKFVAQLCATGSIAPVIHQRHLLQETTDAFRALIEGHVSGKVVVTP